jgi:tRNA threonylcarbamoyl adenosine modification protein YeaZ
MRLLAIDTALAACSAAVFDTDGGIVASESEAMTRGHAEALMPMVARVMAKAATRFDKIDRIAVTVGPGSFTGLRVGVSAARGLALAAGKPAVGVATTTAYAAPYLADNDKIPVLIAIDARNDQAYMQAFGEGGRVLLPAQLAPLRTLSALSFGPMRVIGSAARRVAALWPGEQAVTVDERGAPEIEWVAQIGVAADEKEAPTPLYLGKPNYKTQPASALLRR